MNNPDTSTCKHVGNSVSKFVYLSDYVVITNSYQYYMMEMASFFTNQ